MHIHSMKLVLFLAGAGALAPAAFADNVRVARVFDPAIAVEPTAHAAGHGEALALRITLAGVERRLDLVPNADLEDRSAALVPALADGRQRLYRGTVADRAGSWVRLSRTDGQWEGALWDGTEMWHVTRAAELPDAAAAAGLSATTLAYRGSDARDTIDMRGDALHGRAAPIDLARSLAAMKRGINYNLGLAIVVDTQFQSMFGDEAARVASIVNIIDGYYADASTSVYLNALRLLPSGNAGIVEPSNNNTLLDQFQDYMQTPAAPPFDAAAHLLSGKAGISGGLAYVGTLCLPSFGIGVNAGRHDVGTTAQIVAHELGHNYGADHDGAPGTHGAACPSSGFVMEPTITIGDPEENFSTCSLSEFAVRAPGYACIQGGGTEALFADGFE